ncbi:MAG: DUF1822 family protein [Cyanobacteriota bacterium]|nr:DUF1822 family protein [Cyanobacteriota bacterium]
MNRTASSPLIVPLTPTIRDRARQFAAQQATPEKGLRVYLNTLAVWAVHRYLNWLQIETDLEAGEFGNASLRAIFNVADLVVPSWGKIECCPVVEGEDAIALSPEATQGRKGYVAVELNSSLQEARILGFYPTSVAEGLETLPLNQLQSLDCLLDSIPETETAPVYLSQWLQNLFDPAWQSVEALLTPSTPAFAFRRNAIRRAKRLEFEIPLILLLTLQSESRDRLIVHFQLFPVEVMATFPYPTQFVVLAETGEMFREIKSQEGERFVQYELGGERGEQFKVKVVSGCDELIENFII